MSSSVAAQALALLRLALSSQLTLHLRATVLTPPHPIPTITLHSKDRQPCFVEEEDRTREGVPGDVTQPVVSGHKSRVAGPEAMPLGSIRLGTLLLKQMRQRTVCFSSLSLDCSLGHRPFPWLPQPPLTWTM